MNRSRSDDQSENKLEMEFPVAFTTMRSATAVREEGRTDTFPHVASFRSYDFETQSLPATANETESTCRNCSHVGTTFTCSVCGTYNAPHHERVIVSSLDKCNDIGHKPPLGVQPKGTKKVKKSKRSKSQTKSRSQKSRENAESSPKYMSLSDDVEDAVQPTNYAHPASPITPAPRRRSMYRDENGIISPTTIRAQIRILVPSKSEADIPPTRTAEHCGSSTRTMESDFPSRSSLSPIRRGFRDRHDMERATKDARAFQPYERTMNGTHPATEVNVSQASECRTSVPVPSQSLQTYPPNQTTTIGTMMPQAVADNLTAWSDAERNQPWECRTCTFVNGNPLHLSCSICGVLRETGIPLEPKTTATMAFEEQMACLRGDTQQTTVQSKSKKVEDAWFATLQGLRIQEMVEQQAIVLRSRCRR